MSNIGGGITLVYYIAMPLFWAFYYIAMILVLHVGWARLLMFHVTISPQMYGYSYTRYAGQDVACTSTTTQVQVLVTSTSTPAQPLVTTDRAAPREEDVREAERDYSYDQIQCLFRCVFVLHAD